MDAMVDFDLLSWHYLTKEFSTLADDLRDWLDPEEQVAILGDEDAEAAFCRGFILGARAVWHAVRGKL
jgi:hypothetical protein